MQSKSAVIFLALCLVVQVQAVTLLGKVIKVTGNWVLLTIIG
jgi:hypothetical protein